MRAVGAEVQRQSAPFWGSAIASAMGGIELIGVSAWAYIAEGESDYGFPGLVGVLSLASGARTICDLRMRPDRRATQSDVADVVTQLVLAAGCFVWAWNINGEIGR